ncbi:MAG TPA: glycosyltransferase family 2 protein [Caulobacteraceae bacterium]|nr:glycosyltransferase family 2 protein [Caulobacteraceae bacterium]
MNAPSPSDAAATPEISIVIPCRNEEANVEAIAAAAIAEVTKHAGSYEIVFIDNRSTDRTVELVKSLCRDNPNVRLIVNSRNFGQMRSPTHAIYQTRGAAVIGLCADFQDPPEMIGEFISRWRAGAKIVLGVRKAEDSPLSVRIPRRLGYGLLNRLGDYAVIEGATGFGLYDRAVVDCLAGWNEPEPFFRGMLVESGYRLETIPYERPPRAGGRSNNNLSTSIDFALSAFASSAKQWLRLPIYLSLFVAALAGLALIAAIVLLAVGRSPWGMLGVFAAALGFAGAFFFLGLIGDQVRVISERTRNVPLVVEEERINF